MAPAKYGFPASSALQRPGENYGWAIKGIFFIALISMLNLASGFIIPVVMAFLLFFVFAHLRRVLVRRGVPVWLIGTAILIALIFGIIAISALLIAPATQFLNDIPQISGKLEAKLDSLRGSVDMIDAAIRQFHVSPEMSPDNVSGNAVLSLVSATPELMGQVIFVLVLLFFLILSGDLLYLRIVQSFDTMGDKRAAYRALRDIEDSLGQYLGAISVINALLGLAVGLVMWALGMPSPAMFGILAFLLNYVPYLGAVAGIGLATLVALLSFPGVVWPLLVGSAYLTLTTVEGQIITPYFVSRRLQMNPVFIFMSITLGAYIWGAIGMVVAVPLMVVISVIADHVPSMHKFGNFLAGEDPLPIDLEAHPEDGVETPSEMPDTGEALPALTPT
jgi:predicted PurR-regulated permease PerM